jgi:hypothetical protein
MNIRGRGTPHELVAADDRDVHEGVGPVQLPRA